MGQSINSVRFFSLEDSLNFKIALARSISATKYEFRLRSSLPTVPVNHVFAYSE